MSRWFLSAIENMPRERQIVYITRMRSRCYWTFRKPPALKLIRNIRLILTLGPWHQNIATIFPSSVIRSNVNQAQQWLRPCMVGEWIGRILVSKFSPVWFSMNVPTFFFAGQQDNKNIPICQCWPPSCLVGEETHAISLISFYRIFYQHRPELECNEERNRKKLKTQRSNWRWFSASCSASFLRSHHVRCCRLQ